ncbi:MAG: HAD family hydrolase [Sorangiineae bacterium]|nr:HAD family hydrolase [Polyangiaceae bacterium]MEB2324448.1 HAD family hydrolase [Sorangiineae bacterium]
MSAVRAVVFDIDDTLYLERDYVRSGFASLSTYAEERWGIANFGERAWQLFLLGARGDIFNRVLIDCGVAAGGADVRALVDRYRAHTPDITLLPDARAALEALHGRFQLAAITDGPLASQQAKARALGLEQWLEPIVFTAALGPNAGKPALDAFQLVEKRLGVSGTECVYVADNPQKDFIAPHELGWRTVRVRRPGGLHHELESAADVRHELVDLREPASTLAPL